MEIKKVTIQEKNNDSNADEISVDCLPQNCGPVLPCPPECNPYAECRPTTQ